MIKILPIRFYFKMNYDLCKLSILSVTVKNFK